jgi:DNA-binding CsgD family transcriptional regulator
MINSGEQQAVLMPGPAPATPTGRTHELDLLVTAAGSAGPVSQFATVVGEPGVGKTHLLSVLGRQLAGDGWQVLSGRATGVKPSSPFGLLADALDTAPAGLGGTGQDRSALPPGLTESDARLLAGVFPAVGRNAPSAGPGRPAAPEDPHRICRAASLLLGALAQQVPLLLLLDDVHVSDQESVRVIDYLARHPVPGRLFIVASYRPRQASVLPWATAGADSEISGLRVLLGPMVPADLDQLIPDEVPEPQRDTLRTVSEGSPGVLHALLLSSPDSAGHCYGAEELMIGVPPVVLQAYPGELRQISPLARLVAEAAAVVGNPFEPDLVAAVAELDEGKVLDGLDELVAVDLVRADDFWRRFRFRDVAVRAVLYHLSGGGWRCSAHGRAAAAFAEHQLPATRSAYHLEHAGSGNGEGARTLVAAARETIFLAPDRAVRWLRTSQRLQPGLLAADVSALLAIALAASGQTARSARLYTEVRDSPDTPPELKAEVAEWCARALRLDGHHQAAHRLISSVPVTARTPGTHIEQLTSALEMGRLEAVDLAELASLGRAARRPAGSSPPAPEAPGAFLPPGTAVGEVLNEIDSGATVLAQGEEMAIRGQALALLAVLAARQERPAEAVSCVREAKALIDRLTALSSARRLEALYWLAEAELLIRMQGQGERHLRLGIELADRFQQAPMARRMRSAIERARGNTTVTRMGLPGPGADPAAASAMTRDRLRGTAIPLARSPLPVTKAADPPPADATLTLLSSREREIAYFVSSGLTNQQIARRLSISPKTVETHMARVFGKLGVSSRTQVAHLVGRVSRRSAAPGSPAPDGTGDSTLTG